MKLFNFYSGNGSTALGAVHGEVVLNLTEAAQRSEFASLSAWLRAGDRVGAETRALCERLTNAPAAALPLAAIRHAALVDRQARIFCVGLNYADHAAENNLAPPPSPIFFSKLAAVVIAHQMEIPIPAIAPDQVDYEAEVALVIGRCADCVSPAEAWACIAGYSIMNDVTARDLQTTDRQWFRGKNCNGFGPLGPWLVTADEIADPAGMDVTLRLNGEVKQHSNTSQLIFPFNTLVSILSQTLVLEPGDVISTGTPAGIGFHQKPPVFLRPGDRVEVEVSGIGILANTVAQAGAEPRSRGAVSCASKEK